MILKQALTRGQHGTYARHRCTTRQPGPPHVHDFIEVFWVEAGDGWHCINGQMRPLRPGHVILVRAEDAHAFAAGDKGYLHFTNVAFFPEAWRHIHRRYLAGRACYFARADPVEREFVVSQDRLMAIRQAAAELHAGARDRLAFERFLLNLLPLLPGRRRTAVRPDIPVWIQETVENLRHEVRFEGGTRALARLAGRSPEHVARAFRRHLQITPTEMLNELRMDYAARRLELTTDKIIDIALDCGLANLGHFYRLFALRFGMTPRQYRLSRNRN